jgi:hypothetical protein
MPEGTKFAVSNASVGEVDISVYNKGYLIAAGSFS